MKAQLFMTIFVLYITAGCAGLKGLMHERTFIEEMELQPESYFVPGNNFPVIPGDEGQAYRSRREISRRTPATAYDKEVDDYQRSIKAELAAKEQKLSPREYRNYVENSEFYPSDSEKIYFLGLSRRERQEYLSVKGGSWAKGTERGGRAPASFGAAPSFESQYNGYIEDMTSRGRELYLGMNKEKVIDTWGRPARVDVAGNPDNENERWSFYERGRVKVVYFESGRVQGWAME